MICPGRSELSSSASQCVHVKPTVLCKRNLERQTIQNDVSGWQLVVNDSAVTSSVTAADLLSKVHISSSDVSFKAS